MSKRVAHPFVRVVSVRHQKRDGDGNKLCLVCESHLPKGRSSYCDDDCYYRNTPRLMRSAVRRRDKGICALCGKDTTKTEKQHNRNTYHDWEMDHIVPVVEGGGLCGLEGYRTLCKGPNSCHAKETKKLHERLKLARQIAKTQKQTRRLFA